MVEILKRGTKKTETCEVCGCVFTYEQEDISFEESPYHGGGDYKYINCPQCDNKIYLENIK